MLGAGSRWTCWWRISTPPTRTTSGHSLETANTTFSHIFPHFRSMFWRIFCWNTFLFVSLSIFLKEKIYVIGSFLISERCIHWTTGVYIFAFVHVPLYFLSLNKYVGRKFVTQKVLFLRRFASCNFRIFPFKEVLSIFKYCVSKK